MPETEWTLIDWNSVNSTSPKTRTHPVVLFILLYILYSLTNHGSNHISEMLNPIIRSPVQYLLCYSHSAISVKQYILSTSK